MAIDVNVESAGSFCYQETNRFPFLGIEKSNESNSRKHQKSDFQKIFTLPEKIEQKIILV